MNGLLARIGLAAIGILFAAWFGSVIHGWKTDAAQLRVARSEIKALQEQHALRLKAAEETAYGYQMELEKIRKLPASVPRRVVRMCQSPPEAMRTDPAPASTDDSTPASGLVPATPGPDIGSDLYDFAQRCEEVGAELRSLQNWVRQINSK